MKVGAVVQMWAGSSLQNKYVLVSDEAAWQSEMDQGISQLLTVDWDTVELALGEFVSADPQQIIDWLDHAVETIAEVAPAVEVNVQNHVGNYPSLWVQYQGQTVFYYDLPQFADPRLGQTVHTLFFDVYRDWATYKHPDFHLQHDYIFHELPTRRGEVLPRVGVQDLGRHRRPPLPPGVPVRALERHPRHGRRGGRRSPAGARGARSVSSTRATSGTTGSPTT